MCLHEGELSGILTRGIKQSIPTNMYTQLSIISWTFDTPPGQWGIHHLIWWVSGFNGLVLTNTESKHRTIRRYYRIVGILWHKHGRPSTYDERHTVNKECVDPRSVRQPTHENPCTSIENTNNRDKHRPLLRRHTKTVGEIGNESEGNEKAWNMLNTTII